MNSNCIAGLLYAFEVLFYIASFQRNSRVIIGIVAMILKASLWNYIYCFIYYFPCLCARRVSSFFTPFYRSLPFPSYFSTTNVIFMTIFAANIACWSTFQSFWIMQLSPSIYSWRFFVISLPISGPYLTFVNYM